MFCEECGSPISAGALFCEECGCKIASIPEAPENNQKENIAEYGIIYTNLGLLSQQLGKPQEELKRIIDDFISEASIRCIGYELLDVSQKINGLGTVEDHVNIIKSEVSVNHQKYLFILGSNTVIPSIVWSNYASDCEHDPDISSDFPYSTLDIQNPFEGQFYDFDEYLRVGRLPNVDFENYFSNLKSACGKINQIKTFGLSAEVWTEETKDIYSEIKAGPNVYDSPDVNLQNVISVIPDETNLMLFNLHGSSQTRFWYGQRLQEYPEAIEPSSFNNISNPYFLAVEACYGAAYEGRAESDSVLLTSLSGKCISFLGSSRIAFGKPYPAGSCADVICGEYLKNLKSNLSAGDSLSKAQAELLQDECSPNEIKTLAEFSLYGDPSARISGLPEIKKTLFSKSKSNSKSFSKGIVVPQPDIRRAVKMQLIEVEQKIKDTAISFINTQYKEFSDIQPKYFGDGKNIINAVFSKESLIGKRILSVQMNKKGEITDFVESK